MANQQHLEWFLSGAGFWNERTKTPSGLLDLSNENLGYRLVNKYGERKVPSYANIDLRLTDLRNSSFILPNMPNFNPGLDLRNAKFQHGITKNTVFFNADLSGATFAQANLKDADFSGANLDGVTFFGADLSGAKLTAARPWRSHILHDLGLNTQGLIDSKRVTSVSDFVSICKSLKNVYEAESQTIQFYFRGQSSTWKLRPSIMRSQVFRSYEGEMLKEAMTRRPEDFIGAHSALSQWVLAQHHGLKTRLLDLTRNPLVALYYACTEKETGLSSTGVIHVFVFPGLFVKTFEDDSISVVANFAKLSPWEQDLLLGKRRIRIPNSQIGGVRRSDYDKALLHLVRLIGQEKPRFGDALDPRDLFRVFVVEPQQSFERIRAQAGAFLISAFHERFEHQWVQQRIARFPDYHHYMIEVPSEQKSEILIDLDMLGISRESMFPSLDESTQAITRDIRSAVTGGIDIMRRWHPKYSIDIR